MAISSAYKFFFASFIILEIGGGGGFLLFVGFFYNLRVV